MRALKSHSRWWADEYEQPDRLAKLDFPKVPQEKPGRIASNSDVDKAMSTLSGYANDYPTPMRDKATLSTFVHTGRSRRCST